MSFNKLTCCGGAPQSCQQLYSVNACPDGYISQFCCHVDGSLTPALIGQDNNGNDVPNCTSLGAIVYSKFDQAACQALPQANCCYNNLCYPSKDSGCMYYGNGSPAAGGTAVANCSTGCPNSTQNPFCCIAGQVCSQSFSTSCDDGYAVPDCSMCPQDDNDWGNY
jgi:hypothetical protein